MVPLDSYRDITVVYKLFNSSIFKFYAIKFQDSVSKPFNTHTHTHTCVYIYISIIIKGKNSLLRISSCRYSGELVFHRLFNSDWFLPKLNGILWPVRFHPIFRITLCTKKSIVILLCVFVHWALVAVIYCYYKERVKCFNQYIIYVWINAYVCERERVDRKENWGGRREWGRDIRSKNGTERVDIGKRGEECWKERERNAGVRRRKGQRKRRKRVSGRGEGIEREWSRGRERERESGREEGRERESGREEGREREWSRGRERESGREEGRERERVVERQEIKNYWDTKGVEWSVNI